MLEEFSNTHRDERALLGSRHSESLHIIAALDGSCGFELKRSTFLTGTIRGEFA
jgi:hypothetical protein